MTTLRLSEVVIEITRILRLENGRASKRRLSFFDVLRVANEVSSNGWLWMSSRLLIHPGSSRYTATTCDAIADGDCILIAIGRRRGSVLGLSAISSRTRRSTETRRLADARTIAEHLYHTSRSNAIKVYKADVMAYFKATERMLSRR